MTDDLLSILEEALQEATAVLEEVAKLMNVAPPTQDQLRDAFRLAMQSPENMQAFEDAFGRDVYDRQMQLALRRNNE